MEESETEGKKPDYIGNIRVGAWKKTDKNGNTYISVKLGSRANLFIREQRKMLEIEDIFE